MRGATEREGEEMSDDRRCEQCDGPGPLRYLCESWPEERYQGDEPGSLVCRRCGHAFRRCVETGRDFWEIRREVTA